MIDKMLRAALVSALLLGPGTAFCGPVNVNTADAKTLAAELQGVGLAKAQAIVAWRDKNGPFRSAEDLAKVKGVGKKLVERNRSNLRFESPKAG